VKPRSNSWLPTAELRRPRVLRYSMVGWSSARFDAKDDAPTLSPADRSSVASAPWVARAVTMLQAKFLPKAPVRSMPPSMRPWKSLKLSSVTLVRSG